MKKNTTRLGKKTSHEVQPGFKFISLNSLHDLFGDLDNSDAFFIFEKSAYLFLQELDMRLDQLESSIRTKSYPKTKFETHRLKGDFNVMGATYLSEICRTLEKNLQARTDVNQDLMYEKYYLLKSCSYLFKEELTDYLKQHVVKVTKDRTL